MQSMHNNQIMPLSSSVSNEANAYQKRRQTLNEEREFKKNQARLERKRAVEEYQKRLPNTPVKTESPANKTVNKSTTPLPLNKDTLCLISNDGTLSSRTLGRSESSSVRGHKRKSQFTPRRLTKHLKSAANIQTPEPTDAGSFSGQG